MKSLVLALSFALAAPAAWAAKVGQAAPDFTAPDVQGKPVKLSEQRGKFVVLEWTNPECPYVRRHYDSGNMQSLQKEMGGKDVVWLTVNSTREGHGEFKSPQEMAKWMSQQGAAPKATLIDKDSKVGKMYDARTTPHMYVIDPQGKLIYAGAIDDKRWASTEQTKTAKNHVRAALGEAMAGKPVSVAATSPYGCTVKY
ncbi:MAG TPA: thioredoxin family protein [Burkholderiales bacterium]|nr:thioredoxin family protein [Burkholderiales bacterium]